MLPRVQPSCLFRQRSSVFHLWLVRCKNGLLAAWHILTFSSLDWIHKFWFWMNPRPGSTHARRTLINLLRELPITMLVSTHEMKLIEELFPRTIVMDEGQIVADGRTNDILQKEELLTAHGLEKP